MNAKDVMVARRDQGSEMRELLKRKRDDRSKEAKGEVRMRDSTD